MAISEQDIQLIEDYVAGKLATEDAAALEARAEAEPELAAELELQRGLAVAVKAGRRMALRERMAGIEGKVDGERASRGGSGGRIWWAVAAAAVLLVVGVWWVWQLPARDVEQEVNGWLALNDVADDDQGTDFRGARDSVLFETGKAHYRNRDYQSAIDSFAKIPDSALVKNYTNYWSGICYLRLENYAAAKTVFSGIMKDRENNLHVRARWHLGITYLRQGEFENAKEIFEEWDENEGYNGQKVAEILEILE